MKEGDELRSWASSLLTTGHFSPTLGVMEIMPNFDTVVAVASRRK